MANVSEVVAAKFKKGDYAVCPCPIGTHLFAVVPPGRMPNCPCGITYKMAEEQYEKQLVKKWQDNEDDQWSDESSDSSKAGFASMKKSSWPAEISKGLQKFYYALVNAYDAEGVYWEVKKPTIGDDPDEALVMLNAKYKPLTNAAKGNLVQPLKEARKHKEAIDALEQILFP